MTVEKTAEKCYPPCRKACPAGINIQAYIALIGQGKFKDALEIIRKYIPLPAVCGRVCFSPCEDACTRKDVDEALNIRALKRLVADYELEIEKREKNVALPRKYDEKIAIIGSGPAGLASAYELVKMGYPVTVFEKNDELGGMLRECLPPYRLPRDVLDIEIQYLKDLGVQMKTKAMLGREMTIDSLFKQGYKAIFLAIGAQRCLRLNVEGEEFEGVFHSLDFLREVNCGKGVDLGDKVVVIGGGNVAIDSARTAKRLGAGEVTLMYRRSEDEMPANRREVQEARLEGVSFVFLASPKGFVSRNGKVVSIDSIRMKLGSEDETGRRRPIPIEGSEFEIPVDSVILAIGETPDVSFLPKELEVTKGNTIVADPVTLETRIPGVFAGGDVVTGPASVVEAMAMGRKAAISIDRYARGIDLHTGREEEISETKWITGKEILEKKPRQAVPSLSPSERLRNFNEIEAGFAIENGIKEALRCLACGPCDVCLEHEDLCESDDPLVDEDRCIACGNCEKVCSYGAIRIKKSVAKVDYVLCKGCGTCAVECPAMAISMTNFTDEKILSSISGPPEAWKSNELRVLVFVCNRCYDGDQKSLKNISNVHVVPVKCVGRVDHLHILRAFQSGASGVLLAGCHRSDCHYISGFSLAEERTKEVRAWLGAIGIEPRRLGTEQTSCGDIKSLTEVVNNFMSSVMQA